MSENIQARARTWRDIFFSGILLMTLSLLLVLILSFYVFMRSPGPGHYRGYVRITIEPGMNFTEVARLLFEQGIIGDVDKFGWLAANRNAETRIQAGEFDLSAEMTPVEVLDRLVNGRPVEYRITVPEGYNLKQIAEVLDQQGIWSGERLLELTFNKGFAASLGVNADTLEGYLFPETYQFPRWAKEEDIIKAMLKKTNQVFGEDELARAAELDMTKHEILTLASLVEKETSVVDEMPLISSVFHRRLRIGMKLDCDPTVIYGIKNFDGNLRRRDIEKWTPYNTYLNQGIPPGPIASPGENAIHAALHPADTRFLYFVSKGDGTHYFSRTFSEHEQAIWRYQLRRR